MNHPNLVRRLKGAVCAAVVLILAVQVTAQTTATTSMAERFEKTVQAYEAADTFQPTPTGAILLAGDSQFYRWKTLHDDLPDFTIVNRGIDSFQLSHVIQYADRLILPHKPRMIILHVGGNDVNNGKAAAAILEDFKTFVAKVRAVLPEVPIAFSSITPGPGRWNQAERRKQTNDVIKAYIETQPGLVFIDLWEAMLTADGQPRDELWVEDRVHPNHAGYLVRVKIMRPLLGQPDRHAHQTR
jgi:lysophospholipase L1-like esterase